MTSDEAIERVVEAVDDMCSYAGKERGMTTAGLRGRLRIALGKLLAAHDAERDKRVVGDDPPLRGKDCACNCCDHYQ